MPTAMILDLLGATAGAPPTVRRILDVTHTRKSTLHVSAQCIRAWLDLRGVLRSQRWLRTRMSGLARLSLDDDEDVPALREQAQRLGSVAAEWEAAYEKWRTETAPALLRLSVPFAGWAGPTIERQLEEIVCCYEDAAETLALAASGSFARLVETEFVTDRTDRGGPCETG